MVWCLGIGSAVFSWPQQGWADAKPNPYLSIVDRNPFGLKDPPPLVAPEPEKPATPPAKVILTGITSLFGPTSKRCFLEITEQEPGKQASILRPILREGEQSGSVEVISIDIEKNMVRIKNSGQELDLKFEDPAKMAAAQRLPGVPAPQPLAYNPAAMGSPTIISPASADNSTRNSSVSMFGSDSTGAPTASTGNNMAGIPTTGIPLGGRSLRTGVAQGAMVDPAAQYARDLIKAKELENRGIIPPPTLPLPDDPAHNPKAQPPPSLPVPGGGRFNPPPPPGLPGM